MVRQASSSFGNPGKRMGPWSSGFTGQSSLGGERVNEGVRDKGGPKVFLWVEDSERAGEWREEGFGEGEKRRSR